MDKEERYESERDQLQFQRLFPQVQEIHSLNNSVSQYAKVMEKIPCEDVELLKIKLQSNGIIINKAFNHSFEKVILRRLGNAYQIKIVAGFFETTISVIKTNIDLSDIERKCFFAGAFSSIFCEQINDETYATKSQEISPKSIANFDEHFDDILKECLALKIACALEFGPKLKKPFGFDIVCFKNSIQFSMELCTLQFASETQVQKKFSVDLLSGLKKMHLLKIIHGDIKNSNIGWSQSFRKWVFLDFGFVSFIQAKPGIKTYTAFKGTYNYISEEMKQLFHLKKNGFIDLYENDLHSLKMTNENRMENFHFCHSFSEASSELLFLVKLTQMEYYIFSYELLLIRNLFNESLQLRNQFLGLILLGISRLSIADEEAKSQLFILYSQLKSEPIEKENCGEERKNLFKLFKAQDKEYNISQFIFLIEKDLEKLLCQKWGQISFMKELFIFFDQVIHSNSQNFWKRMKLITNILVNHQKNLNEKGKSWASKFMFILKIFQQKFVLKKQEQHLKEIQFYYLLLDSQEKVQNNISTAPIIEFIFIFRAKIIAFEEKEEINDFLNYIEKVKEQLNEYQNIVTILRKIALIVQDVFMSKQMTKQKSSLLEQLCKKFQNGAKSSFFNLVIRRIYLLINRFFLMYSPKENIEKKKRQEIANKFYRLSTEKHTALLQVREILQKSSLKQIEYYFQAYPIYSQLPSLTNFQYNFKKRNYSKLNQIVQTIFDFNRNHLEQMNVQIVFMFWRWKNYQNYQQQIKFVFSTFCLSLKNKIHSDRIKKIWRFCYQILFFLKTSDLKGYCKQQYLSPLEFIINFFSSKSLSPAKKIYVELFLNLHSFLKTNIFKVDQWLNDLEKKSLMKQLRQNQFVLCDFLQFVTASQIISSEFRFRGTSFYSEILENKTINWHFYKNPLLFRDVLITKTHEDKYEETINILKSFTLYMTLNDIFPLNVSLYFGEFINASNHTKLEAMFMSLISEERLADICADNFLSAFIFMIYRTLEQKLLQKLNLSQIKRTKKLSIIKIDYFPDAIRIQLRNFLKYKFRKIEQNFQLRKKRVIDRQEDYARGKFILWKKQFQKKMEKKERFHRNFKKKFDKKLEKIEQNLKSLIPEKQDSKFTKIF